MVCLFFVFQNRICKINTITHFTLQGFLYTQWYSIVSLCFFNTSKVWLKTTETTAIQSLLTILEHWGIIVKLKNFHTFWISDWNFKYFKFICILCIVMALKKFLIIIRCTFAKIYFNPIKVNIKPRLSSCRLTLELKFSFIFILICCSEFQIVSPSLDDLCIKSLFHQHSLYAIFN